MKSAGLKIIIADLPDYRELVAEIYLDGKFVALISQEIKPGCFCIETPPNDCVESEVLRRVDLIQFQEAIAEGCKRLKNDI